jgi:hypothetical protein
MNTTSTIEERKLASEIAAAATLRVLAHDDARATAKTLAARLRLLAAFETR